MLRFALALVTLTVVGASLHGDILRVRRAADTYVSVVGGGARVKRQATSDSFPLQSGQQCFRQCIGEFKAFLKNITGGELDLKSIQNGFFDKDKLFNDAEILPQFCGEYTSVKTCTNECAHFEGRDRMVQSLAGLEFICVDRYDEFIAYQPCYANLSASSYDAICKGKCGGEDYVLEQVAKLDNFGSKPDFGALMAIMGNLCGFISCHLDCQRPNFVETCGTEAPADLLDEFIAKTIGGAMKQLEDLGLGELIPQQCTAITDPNAVTVVDDDAIVDFSTDKTSKNEALQKKKLQLEMKVLNKEYEKLELEIANLKLHKQVLVAQLAKTE